MSPRKGKGRSEKIIHVREHPMHVPVSKKNPTGITIRRAHDRHINCLSINDIHKIFGSYPQKWIIFPAKGRLLQYKNADQYDDLIAVWCDYYNKLFPPVSLNASLDPNVLKALIASESGFRFDPPGNKKAIGIAQITPATWKIIQDAEGELKDHLFKGIRKKDLLTPEVAIPVAARWLFHKKELAALKLKKIRQQRKSF